MKGAALYKERFSDRNIFWVAMAAVMTASHVNLYFIIGVYLTGMFEAAWAAVGVAALASSYAASRMPYRRSAAWRMFVRMFLQRWGACWNAFVLLASAFMAASRIAFSFYPVSAETRFVFSCTLAFLICLYGLAEGSLVRVVRI